MDGHAVLVVSASGRALAASGHRAGIPVVVLDQFNDLDTRQLATASAHCGGSRGFSAQKLRQAARALAPAEGYGAVVIGSGLESRADLRSELSRLAPLAGNDAECINLSKDPGRFFALLDTLGIPHPEVCLEPPRNPQGWLSKRVGGAGGVHVRAAHLPLPRDGRRYFQRYVAGDVMSVLFLADGRCALRIGVHRLQTWPLSDRVRFAYGGAVRLLDAPMAIADAIDDIVSRLAEAMGLRGLNGLDFVLGEGGITVLELNARPTATVDLNDERVPGGLLRAHLAACGGELPEGLSTVASARAHAILWARQSLRIPDALRWPAWVSDIPAPGNAIARGRPMCTVHAEAAETDAAQELAGQRAESIWRTLTGGPDCIIHQS